jgi:hypothetical protein
VFAEILRVVCVNSQRVVLDPEPFLGAHRDPPPRYPPSDVDHCVGETRRAWLQANLAILAGLGIDVEGPGVSDFRASSAARRPGRAAPLAGRRLW